MGIDYLYSIVNLYLKKETDVKKTYLMIKKLDDKVEFSNKMQKSNEDKTTFVIPYDDYSKCLLDFLKKYKGELMTIDEKYDYDNVSGNCKYFVLFNSGRCISFNGFSVLEMNNVRNELYDININQDELRLEEIKDEKQMVYQPRLRLQQAGFSSFATLFLVVMIFAMILIAALLVFKAIFN